MKVRVYYNADVGIYVPQYKWLNIIWRCFYIPPGDYSWVPISFSNKAEAIDWLSCERSRILSDKRYELEKKACSKKQKTKLRCI